jgi:hypothetical protein
MEDQKRPLKPGDAASPFTLPAANREGTVSLSDLRGQPFLIGPKSRTCWLLPRASRTAARK